MSKLPSRPNLEHLKSQAKSLLAALAAGDGDAVTTFQEFLPGAKAMTASQVKKAGFRLADAQSAVARKSGFAAWPQLSRHVEQLRSLEGTWAFVRLEIDGAEVPAAGYSASRMLMDGDRFRMESPEATYEGTFNIDIDAEPHAIDIGFVAGPEAGNTNHGIFRLKDDELEICLDMSGRSRPKEFRTTAGSGHACETLKRVSGARPQDVKGGTPPLPPPKAVSAASPGAVADQFTFVASDTLTKLQGEWTAELTVRDGQDLPDFVLKSGRRSAEKNEVKVYFGGMLMVYALVRINEESTPMEIDYLNTGGPAKGSIQFGIMEWRDGDACFCMAAPGQPRPTDFSSAPGSGRTLSQWRPKK